MMRKKGWKWAHVIFQWVLGCRNKSCGNRVSINPHHALKYCYKSCSIKSRGCLDLWNSYAERKQNKFNSGKFLCNRIPQNLMERAAEASRRRWWMEMKAVPAVSLRGCTRCPQTHHPSSAMWTHEHYVFWPVAGNSRGLHSITRLYWPPDRANALVWTSKHTRRKQMKLRKTS